MSNQCESKFDGEVSVSCLLELVADVRKGPSAKTLLQAMWLLGCLIAKFATPQSGIASVGYAAMSESLEGLDIDPELGREELESVLCAIETKCGEREVSIQSGPAVGTQGWEVFIPLILELVKMIIENRKKKQQPAPQPGT
jgi:hypothetical protein